MGELKGQLLSVLLVLVIFGAIGGALYGAYVNTKTKITEKTGSLETTITTGAKQAKLLEFKD